MVTPLFFYSRKKDSLTKKTYFAKIQQNGEKTQTVKRRGTIRNKGGILNSILMGVVPRENKSLTITKKSSFSQNKETGFDR